MNIVQPGSATTRSNGVALPATWTCAARRSPTTGCSTTTGTSMTSRPAASPFSPSPSTRIVAGSLTPLTVTRTSCSGLSARPPKSSVDPAARTRIPPPPDVPAVLGCKAGDTYPKGPLMPALASPVADERSALREYLAYHQSAFFAVAYGLTDEQARSSPTVSELSIGGVGKHVTAMQHNWMSGGAPGAPAP